MGQPFSDASCEEGIVQPLLSIKAHQSGINSLSTIILPRTSTNDCTIKASTDDYIILIASCGDDSAICVNRCSVTHDNSIKVLSQVQKPNAHHSAVTGMCIFIASYAINVLA